MGNARWRLETVLNCTSETLEKIGRLGDVEIIVADWGSDVPLAGVLRLSESARRCVRFLHVPPSLAIERQKDSAFPEVLALNAAYRRSSGTYVGRIDNDTIAGASFFKRFFDLLGRVDEFDFDPAYAFMFVHRRCVPVQFARVSPSMRAVRWLIGGFAPLLPVERINKPNHFFQSPVGIMLLHRDMWNECGAYDESLLYWGWMECDLAFRLKRRYPVIDLGEHIGRSFFHLEHYDPKAERTVSRKCNPRRQDNVFHPNGQKWGLADVALELMPERSGMLPLANREPLWRTALTIFHALIWLPQLNVKWLSRDWPFSLILFEPKTGHLRRRFRPAKQTGPAFPPSLAMGKIHSSPPAGR